MLPIMITPVMENMSNPLHPILAGHLPQLSSTFSLGDFAGAVALIVSAITFYISHTQASQSEQIKTSREIWAVIKEKFDQFLKEDEKTLDIELKEEETGGRSTGVLEGLEMEGKRRPIFDELDYFAYLILTGEIKDKVVLNYYKGQLDSLIKQMDVIYPIKDEVESPDAHPNLSGLLKKWKMEPWTIG